MSRVNLIKLFFPFMFWIILEASWSENIEMIAKQHATFRMKRDTEYSCAFYTV